MSQIRELTQFSIIEYTNANDTDIESNVAPKFVAMRIFEKMAEEGKLADHGGAENIKRVRHMSNDALEFEYKRPIAEIREELRKERIASQKLLVYAMIGGMFQEAMAAHKALIDRATLLLTKRYPEALPEGDAERQKVLDDALKDAKAQLARESQQKGGKKPFQKRQDGRRNGRKHQGGGKAGQPRSNVQRTS